MPAQVEEIEAAEREGIVVRTGLAPVEVVGRDGAVVGIRCIADPADRRPARPADRGRRGSRSPAPRSELPAATILVAVGEEPDPSILPEGAGIEVSGWAGIVADPRTLATGRAGIFAGGDVVSGPEDDHRRRRVGPPGRRVDPRVPGRASPTASARSSRRSATATAPEGRSRLDLATRPRAHAPAADGPAGLVRGDPGRVRRGDRAGARPAAASAATRSTAGRVVDVRAGRGPDVAGHATDPITRHASDIAGGTR